MTDFSCIEQSVLMVRDCRIAHPVINKTSSESFFCRMLLSRKQKLRFKSDIGYIRLWVPGSIFVGAEQMEESTALMKMRFNIDSS